MNIGNYYGVDSKVLEKTVGHFRSFVERHWRVKI